MSNDASAEVSVPTDLTVTSDGDSEDGFAASRRHARELQALVADRAELQRTVEKQKLELQSKNAKIAALTAQHETALANAVSQKDDVISTKQIQTNKLEAELVRAREELSTLKEKAARELAQLVQKCAVFQENQKRLTLKQNELRTSLADLQLSEGEYSSLRQTPSQQLTLQQFTALRVYEMVWPLRLKVNELEAVKSSLESAVRSKDSNLKSRVDENCRLKEALEEQQRRSENYASQLISLKDEQKSDDFKVRNYQRVKSERDQLEAEKNIFSKKAGEYELLAASLKKERNILEERYGELKLKARKQEYDLSQQQEQLRELKNRLDTISESFNSTTKSLRIEQERNAELHEKYVTARGEVTSLSENLNDQQHETRLLKERLQASNNSVINLQSEVTHITQRNDFLSSEVEKYKIRYESEVSKLEEEVKELRMSLSSASKNKDAYSEENAKLHEELQGIKTTQDEGRVASEREISLIREELTRAKQTLRGYQALEAEYEKTVRTAASLPENEANKLLDRMLPGMSVANNRALEQSVQLTRRVLKLETQNTEACTTIKQLSDALEHMKSTISSYKSAISLAGQPSASLLQRIASQEDQIATLQSALQHSSTLQSTLEEENKSLIRELTKLKHEVEKTTAQADELNAIRQQLQILQQSIPQLSHTGASPRSRTHHPGHVPSDAHTSSSLLRGSLHHQDFPKAIIITKESRGRK